MNNKLKFSTLIISVALGAGSLQAYAFGTADDVDQDSYTTTFKTLDKDNDGTLDKAELKGDKTFAGKHFGTADKDNDGTLDQDEYSEYKSQVDKKNVKRVASDTTITSKVKGALLKDQGMKGLKVHVKTTHGVVMLSGFVDSEAQIQQAKDIAKSIDGVKSVKSSLAVKKAE